MKRVYQFLLLVILAGFMMALGGQRAYATVEDTENGMHRYGTNPTTDTLENLPLGGFTIAWQANFGAEGYDLAYDITSTSDGGFVAVGRQNDNLFAVKTDGNGGFLWQQELNVTPLTEAGYSVEETNDGNYIIIGSTAITGSQGLRPWLVKLATDGTVLWSTESGLSQNVNVSSAFIRGIERTDGTFAVIGGQNSYTDIQRPWRIIVAADGTLVDFDVYEHPIQGFGAGTYINDLFPTADNGFAFTGYVGPLPGEGFLWKFDGAGEPEWVKTYQTDGFRAANGGREVAGGGYILSGCAIPNCNRAMILRADATGDALWTETYTPLTGYAQASDIIQKADGTFLMGEIGYSAVGDWDYTSTLVELDEDGNRLTETPLIGGTAATYIQRLRLTNDGFILAGNMRNENDPNALDFFIARGIFDTGVPNTAPVAATDNFTTLINQPLTVTGAGVLSNDTDADGDALMSVTYGYAEHGTVTLNGNGGFTYTPDPDYVGTDTFGYIATDGRAMSAPMIVNVLITPEQPTAITLAEWNVAANNGWILSTITGFCLVAAIIWLFRK
jgi:hypothetical protein